MARILEISRIPLFKYCRPDETVWFSLGSALIAGDAGCQSERFTLRNIWRLIRDLRAGVYDLVVLPAVDIRYAYDPHWRKRLIRRLVQGAAASRIAAAVFEAIFRWSRNVVVFEDVSDSLEVSWEMTRLVPGFVAYFKRELVPEMTLGEDAPWPAAKERVVPWSLFLPSADFVPEAADKKTDVFFSGHQYNQMRQDGMIELCDLAASGYRIDVPAERLNYRDYLQRMAQAWLVWSPEGFGWDCYRHYEAAFAGAVPVINAPARSRAKPYEGEVECFYYPPKSGALKDVLVAALGDKERLREMAGRARARVVASYTRAALVAKMQDVIVRRLRAEHRSSRLREEWAAPAAN